MRREKTAFARFDLLRKWSHFAQLVFTAVCFLHFADNLLHAPFMLFPQPCSSRVLLLVRLKLLLFRSVHRLAQCTRLDRRDKRVEVNGRTIVGFLRVNQVRDLGPVYIGKRHVLVDESPMRCLSLKAALVSTEWKCCLNAAACATRGPDTGNFGRLKAAFQLLADSDRVLHLLRLMLRPDPGLNLLI